MLFRIEVLRAVLQICCVQQDRRISCKRDDIIGWNALLWPCADVGHFRFRHPLSAVSPFFSLTHLSTSIHNLTFVDDHFGQKHTSILVTILVYGRDGYALEHALGWNFFRSQPFGPLVSNWASSRGCPVGKSSIDGWFPVTMFFDYRMVTHENPVQSTTLGSVFDLFMGHM